MDILTANDTLQAAPRRRSAPPPKPRVSPGTGESQVLAVRVGADRTDKVKRMADKFGQSPAEFMRWLIDSVPE